MTSVPKKAAAGPAKSTDDQPASQTQQSASGVAAAEP